MRAQPSTDLFTTTLCKAEIFYGLALLPASHRRVRLERAVTAIFDEDFAERILPFDGAAARAFAGIAAHRRGLGRPINEFDAAIAAIARSCRATVATRNLADFSDCGIGVISPWAESG